MDLLCMGRRAASQIQNCIHRCSHYLVEWKIPNWKWSLSIVSVSFPECSLYGFGFITSLFVIMSNSTQKFLRDTKIYKKSVYDRTFWNFKFLITICLFPNCRSGNLFSIFSKILRFFFSISAFMLLYVILFAFIIKICHTNSLVVAVNSFRACALLNYIIIIYFRRSAVIVIFCFPVLQFCSL